MKLSKKARKDHEAAQALIYKPSKSHEDYLQIFEDWNELAENTGANDAYFTPWQVAEEVARSLYLDDEGAGVKILDACSGIGVLAYFVKLYYPKAEVHCVELDQKYSNIGAKLNPTCHHHNESIFDHDQKYAFLISNPPFSQGVVYPVIKHLISLSADRNLENFRLLLAPTLCGFQYSGTPVTQYLTGTPLQGFEKETRTAMHPVWPVDLATLGGKFKNTQITVEIANLIKT